MSDKFRIEKIEDDERRRWWLAYSDGFDEFRDGCAYSTFDEAVDAFVEALNRRCITCDRGAVVDTLTGWECTACGSYDTATVHQ